MDAIFTASLASATTLAVSVGRVILRNREQGLVLLTQLDEHATEQQREVVGALLEELRAEFTTNRSDAEIIDRLSHR